MNARLSFLFVSAAAACAPADAETRPETPPGQYVVAVDLSGSISASERSSNRQLIAEFAQQLDFGERLVVLEAHADGVKNTPRPVVIDVPDAGPGGYPLAEDSLNRTETIRIRSRDIDSIFGRSEAPLTDLFTTLHTAAERLREAPERPATIVMLSDMLQCARGICMERPEEIPGPEWVAQHAGSGDVPNLKGACVVVVGGDASTVEGRRVRDFWVAYFEAAGARLQEENYSYSLTSPQSLRCGR